MKTFRFPLQRVLEWRALQLRVEEEKLAGLQQQLASLLQMREKLAAERNRSQSHLFASGTAAGSDLQTWALYQARLVKQQELLKTQLLQCEKLTLEQRQRLLKARTDHRVLERLKERRWRQWVYLNDREQEDTAAEVYLSKWSREDLENKSAEVAMKLVTPPVYSPDLPSPPPSVRACDRTSTGLNPCGGPRSRWWFRWSASARRRWSRPETTSRACG